MSISESESELSNSESCGSDDETSEYSSEEEPQKPPIPQTVYNWWLNENLGSGYSGVFTMCLDGIRKGQLCSI